MADKKREVDVVGKSRSGRIEATLIPGDGIGPEIVEATNIVLDELGSPFAWDAGWQRSRRAATRCRKRRSTASAARGWR